MQGIAHDYANPIEPTAKPPDGMRTLRIGFVWSQLPASHRRWIILRALLATAVLNVVVNAVIAWLSVRSQPTVSLWGLPLVETSIFWNVVGTLFLLPLITCLLVTSVLWRDVRLGSLISVSHLRSTHHWLAVLPPDRLLRGVAFGAIAVAMLAPIVTLVLIASGSPELTREQFVVCQTAFAVAIGAIVTPVIALYAMADPARSPRVA
jgi:hypothetical protein